jgi:hypothetical protein
MTNSPLTRDERKALADTVRYKHFKISYPDESPCKIDGPKKRVAHATVAYVIENETCWLGYTFCAPDDQYERKIGRSHARRRLFKAMAGDDIGPCDGMSVAGPMAKAFVPGKHFVPFLERWLRSAKDQGIAADRWYYEIPSVSSHALEIVPLERKR